MPRTATSLLRAAAHAAVFAWLWIVMTGEAGAGWGIGVPAVVAATATALALRGRPQGSASAAGALRFIGFFLGESLRGAWDVARRALHPRLPIAPALLRHAVQLPPGAPRTAFVNAVGLLPGTLVATLEGDCVVIHSLDRGPGVAAQIADLERRIGAVFGVPLSTLEDDRP